MRLICLDDDPRVEAVLGRFLRRLQHDVSFYRSITPFKTALLDDPPDAVLLDLGLGRESGIDVIHWLARAGIEVPILLLSGHGDNVLDTVRRIATASGVQVLGAVPKARLVTELPVILARDVKPAPAAKPDLGNRTMLSPGELAGFIRAGRVEPYFQPIVFPGDGSLRGVEVLARLRLPDGTVLGADDFIALAESSGLLYAVTEALFGRLIATRGTLATLGLTFVSVNLSQETLRDPRILGLVRRLVAGLAATCAIEIEVTETSMSADPQTMRTAAAQIHLLGVSLAIDDFGVGYSSIRALAELPFDTLKIDLSFVAEMLDSGKALRVFHAIVAFGRSLGLQVIAEGVETEEQRQRIASQVDLVQGHLFGEPMTADALLRKFAGHAAPAPCHSRVCP
ncbi:EAL domain-containing response regulator [Thioalkalivibrio sp.]|uniref:EAL domain-containing response regulator n=1 Tax=Thioalkalivibrio sp. TaxID=2093813 RepID=UPI0025E5FCE2|nr:EAL domain-containing response regulator [Thioalkalivibrio sp.]